MKTFNEFIEEARKLRILRTAHYTNNDSKAKILQSGFKDSPSTGAYHPDNNKRTVYTTPSSRVGRDYGHARVNLKIMNPKATVTNSPGQYSKKVKELVMRHEGDDLQQRAKEESPYHQSRRAISAGSKIVIAPDAHQVGRSVDRAKGSYIMVDRDVANKSIDRSPQNQIRATNKPRRKKPKVRTNK